MSVSQPFLGQWSEVEGRVIGSWLWPSLELVLDLNVFGTGLEVVSSGTGSG